jgi:hypothetical protein
LHDARGYGRDSVSIALSLTMNDDISHSAQGKANMAANKLVQARVDGAIKEEAAAVLAAMGPEPLSAAA